MSKQFQITNVKKQCAYCDKSYPSKKVFTHFKDCPEFKDAFKSCVFTLTDVFDNMREKKGAQHLSMYEDILFTFIDHTHKQMIKKGLPPTNRFKFPNQGLNSHKIVNAPKLNGHDPYKEEEKFFHPKKPKPVAVPMIQCQGPCGQEFPDSSNSFVYLNECLHIICKECLENIAFECMVNKKMGDSGANCPKCGINISKYELSLHLGKQKLDEFLKLYQTAILSGLDTIRCPNPDCKNMMCFEPGKVDYSQKDQQGNVLSKQSAEHFANNRIRCGSCTSTFCKQCKQTPYHIGKTCQEFEKFKNAKHCRFCGNMVKGKSSEPIQAFKQVCNSPECKELKSMSCNKMLGCGHPCRGFKDEKKCLPCMDPECPTYEQDKSNRIDGSQYCGICYISEIMAQPAVRLQCGHAFHFNCVIKKIESGYQGPRITFGFAQCPACRKFISAPHCQKIDSLMKKYNRLYKLVCEKSMQRLKHEGYDKDARLSDPNDQFYQKPQEYALRKLSYFMCYKCKEPYFGGLRDCRQADDDARQFKPEELVCGKCSSIVAEGVTNCKLHGKDFIDFKCKFCCSVASWFCWGTTHFCDPCHKKQNAGDYLTRKKQSELPQCGSADKCPLKMKHPINGKEQFALGCAICRNNQANFKEF